MEVKEVIEYREFKFYNFFNFHTKFEFYNNSGSWNSFTLLLPLMRM